MQRLRRMVAMLAVWGVVVTLPNAGWSQQFRAAAISPDEVRGVIKESREVVEGLLQEYQSTNDTFVLRCLRQKRQALNVLSATVTQLVQRYRPNLAQAEDSEITRDAGGIADDAQGEYEASLSRLRVEAEAKADEARECLRVQSGEVVQFSAERPEPPPEDLEDQPTESLPIPNEPEPDDLPVSPVTLP